MSVFSLIKGNKANLFLLGLFGATMVFLGLIFFANDYSVQTDYLVIQQSAEKQDFYTLSKSVEYSGNILKAAIASDLFFEEAAKTGYFNASAFSSNERDRLKAWRKSISVSQRSGAGILEVTVERPTQGEAMGIARAVSETLINKNNLFRSGTPESITIKTISGPVVEQNPTVSHLIAGGVSGMMLGMSLVLLWKFSRASKKNEIRFNEISLRRERELEAYQNRFREETEKVGIGTREVLPEESGNAPANLPYQFS